MKTAILFVTHIYNEDIERQIIKLHEETKDFATLYVGFQADIQCGKVLGLFM